MAIFCVPRRRSFGVACRLLGLISVFCAGAQVDAAVKRWNNMFGGAFNAAANWSGGVPGSADIAEFGVATLFTPGTYTVDFDVSPTNQAIRVEDDFVTFDLNGRTYTTTAITGTEIGTVAGQNGRLTITDGIWNLPISDGVSQVVDIGAVAGASGTLIAFTGGRIQGDPAIVVGADGAGTLIVQNGGDIFAKQTSIGFASAATATITGAGSTFINNTTLSVHSNSTMTISLGGLVQNSDASISSGTVMVTDLNSRWNNTQDLFLSGAGSQLTVANGGRVDSNNGFVGFAGEGHAAVGDASPGRLVSQWIISGLNGGTLAIGASKLAVPGSGTLDILANGRLENIEGIIAGGDNSVGEVTLSSLSAQWLNSGALTIGQGGDGTLHITAGLVQNVDGIIGDEAGSAGSVIVDGQNSRWINSGELIVGDSSTDATLEIRNRGFVQSGEGATISFGGSGTVSVDGAGSQWEAAGIDVALTGSGTLNITAGGSVVNSGAGAVGGKSSAVGMARVDGAGSRWTNLAGLAVGVFGSGTLDITNGGVVSNTHGRIATVSIGTGVVNVSGNGSRWTSAGNLSIGPEGAGTLNITAGGDVVSGTPTDDTATIGSEPDSIGIVTVDGAGSTWMHDGDLFVGGFGSGQINIQNGGVVSNHEGKIGLEIGPVSRVNVTGAGSAWINSGDLAVGDGGSGDLNILAGGAVSSADSQIAQHPGSDAIVTVEGAGSTWTIDGKLGVGNSADDLGSGGRGSLRIRPGGTVHVALNTVIFPDNAVRLQGGTFDTTAISFLGNGLFEFSSGTLHVGTFNGNLTNLGGTLAPGHSAGTTTITGVYAQQAGGKLEIEIGGTAPGTAYDVVTINSFAGISGQLQLVLMNGFVPGASDTFTVFSAASGIFGTFTNVTNGQRLNALDSLGSFLVHYGPGSTFNPNQIVLSAFEPTALPGDFNFDGKVDAADYVVWRKGLGSTHTQNGFNIWRANFGAMAGSGGGGDSTVSATAPEPAPLVLMSLALISFALSRRRIMHRSKEDIP